MNALPRLRQHTAKLVSYCRDGLTWSEMQRRLEDQGTTVALSSIQRFCGRHGFSKLHPGSRDYSPTISRQWEAGLITLANLKPSKKTKI